MAAVRVEMLVFHNMSEAELRQWVEANPGRDNNRDGEGYTPLISAAAARHKYLSLVVWLLDEKGADVNGTMVKGRTALHYVTSLGILIALLDRGADPTIADRDRIVPLMWQAGYGTVDTVKRLLQKPRIRATVNMQNWKGDTALYYACKLYEGEKAALKVYQLLQVGANPTLTNTDGLDPLAFLRQFHPPHHHAAIVLLEHALAEAEKASLLVKARRLAVAANSNVVAPCCLQARVARGQPLPRIVLATPTVGQNDGEEEEQEGEESRTLRTALAFMSGLGREGMPRDVFRVVMDLLMPSWDPLRRENTGAVPQMPPQG